MPHEKIMKNTSFVVEFPVIRIEKCPICKKMHRLRGIGVLAIRIQGVGKVYLYRLPCSKLILGLTEEEVKAILEKRGKK